MIIEFFKKDTGEVLKDTNDFYFVMNNVVYCDNGKSYESQCGTVSFDDFVVECPELGWRIKNTK